jgi:hypothetical protein
MIRSIIVKYSDGQTEEIGSPHHDLQSATKAAVELADYLGREGHPGTERVPRWVEVYCDSTFLISVQVFRGGLLATEDSR